MTAMIHAHPHHPIADGVQYGARVIGERRPDGSWAGWLRFVGSDGVPIDSPRETLRGNREELLLWATGLQAEDVDEALARARRRP